MNIRLFLKLAISIIISYFLSLNFDYSHNTIINYEFILNAILSLFGIALAITAIFFTVLDRLKQNSKNDGFEMSCNPILSEMIDNVKGLLFIIIAYFSVNLFSNLFINISLFLENNNIDLKSFSFKSFVLVLGLILALLISYDITISIGKLIKIMIMTSSPSKSYDKYAELAEVARKLDDDNFKKLLDYLRKLIIEQANKNQ